MHILSVALSILVACGSARADIASGVTCDPRNYCAGTRFEVALQKTHLCGDKRLGPLHLDADNAPKDLLEKYAPFGKSCPGAFLGEFGKDQWYRYPPEDGFNLDAHGKPIKMKMTLTVGTLVDRFGAEGGTFVSPCGTPYEKRSLPPANLVPYPADPSHPFNYHVYKVIKAFPVLAGPIAPFFGQPGLGVQYKLDPSISSALKAGYLEMHAANCAA